MWRIQLGSTYGFLLLLCVFLLQQLKHMFRYMRITTIQFILDDRKQEAPNTVAINYKGGCNNNNFILEL